MPTNVTRFLRGYRRRGWRRAALICGAIGLGGMPYSNASAETPEQMSRRFDDAQFRRDVAALRQYLASDMVYINGAGRVGGDVEFIAAFSGNGVTFEPFIITDRKLVMLSKDVGVVTADGTIKGTDNGKSFREHFRYSDTFALRKGRWQVVYVQVTKLPE